MTRLLERLTFEGADHQPDVDAKELLKEKEKEIEDLKKEIEGVKRVNEHKETENEELKKEIEDFKKENEELKKAHFGGSLWINTTASFSFFFLLLCFSLSCNILERDGSFFF